MRSFKPDLVAACDFGGSLTKIIYQRVPGSPQVLVMAPEVAQTPDSRWVSGNETGQLGSAPPESRAWVQVNSDTTSETWAVGALARELYAPPGLRGVKWERAVYKTLAAVWVMQQKLGLRSSFKAAITCVLPPGEYEDRRLFETQLQQTLAAFNTPTGTLKVTLGQFDCRPECAGVALRYSQECSIAGTCAFLMIGFRNASVLVAHNGRFSAGKTSDLGFVRCLELIQQQTSGLTTESLLSAIVQANQIGNAVPYLGILPYRDESIKKTEARRLVTLVAEAQEAYAQMLFTWLDEVLPLVEQPSLAFYGGTIDLIQPALERYQPQLLHTYNVGVSLPAELDVSGLGSRLADVYSIFTSACQQWKVSSQTPLEVA